MLLLFVKVFIKLSPQFFFCRSKWVSWNKHITFSELSVDSDQPSQVSFVFVGVFVQHLLRGNILLQSASTAMEIIMFFIFDVMLILLVARASCVCGSSDCGCLWTCMATAWVLVSQPKKTDNEQTMWQNTTKFTALYQNAMIFFSV